MPVLATALSTPLTPVAYVAGIAVCAGAALLPDIDHPDAKMNRIFGPISRTISRITAKLAHGHRKGTHTLFFCLLAFLAVCYQSVIAAWVAPRLSDLAVKAGPLQGWVDFFADGLADGRLGAFLIIWYFAGVGLLALGYKAFSYGLKPLLYGGALAWVTVYALPMLGGLDLPVVGGFTRALAESSAALTTNMATPGVTNLLAWMIALGALTHIIGDAMTSGGTWPFALPFGLFHRTKIGLPILGNTDSKREAHFRKVFVLCIPVGVAAGIFFGWITFAL